jgi:hypothetical protein
MGLNHQFGDRLGHRFDDRLRHRFGTRLGFGKGDCMFSAEPRLQSIYLALKTVVVRLQALKSVF